MTSEEKKAIIDLTITPHQRTPRISKEEFAHRFPRLVEHGKLPTPLIEAAYQQQNGEDLEFALIIGAVFGCAPEQNQLFCRLIDANWHVCHEDIVSMIEEIGSKDQETVEALYRATQTVPTYLDFDEARALAVKAIWALGKMGAQAADEKLRVLTQSQHPRLRDEALHQLHRRKTS